MKSIVFLVCSGIGYLIGHYFGTGALAAYSSILISYHLYLAFLVVTAEKESGLSLPVAQTIVTHAACLAVIIGLAIGRHYIPFFGIIRLFIPAIAPFEVTWLFNGSKKNQHRVEEQIAAVLSPVPSVSLLKETVAAAPIAPAVQAPVPAPLAHPATVTFDGAPVAAYSFMTPTPAPAAKPTSDVEDDYEDFIKHMQSGKRPFRKPGITVRQEFDLWLAHRAKTRQAEAAAAVRGKTQARA
jgi:hypothetical protein